MDETYNTVSSIRIHHYHRIVKAIIIRSFIWVIYPQWVHTQPHCPFRVKVTYSIIIQPCLLIQFLGIEKIWRSPTAVAFLHKHLAVRDVQHVLGNAAVKISDHGRAAKVVGMVEVNGWCRFSCGLGPKSVNNRKSPLSQQNDWLFT